MIQKDLRVAVFVDAANTYICTAQVFRDKRVNYEALLEWAVGPYKLVRAIVYAVKHGDKMDSWANALGYMGYEVKIKEPSRYHDGASKADWDVTMAMDIARIIEMVDMVVIVSGDGDFVEVVRFCQERGRIVRVIGVDSSTSRKLKDSADIYTPITDRVLMVAPVRREEAPVTPTLYPETKGHSDGEPSITQEERDKMDADIDAAEKAEKKE